MTTPAAQPAARTDLSDRSVQALLLLRAGFAIAPILFGLDKFVGVLADWPAYLWPGLAAALPGSGETLMLGVGAVEIAAGILVALRPRLGAWVVAAWLAGIVVNLLLLGDFYDVALRDVGLLLGALALARLAARTDHVGDIAKERR